MGAALLDFNYQLETLECASCCMTFAIPGRFIRDRRKDHHAFYCPKGHSNVYNGKSEAEKLRDQLAAKERVLEWQRGEVAALRKRNEHTEHRLRATKAVVTKTKARIAKGKCPRCSNVFADLAKHMEHQHPDYADTK